MASRWPRLLEQPEGIWRACNPILEFEGIVGGNSDLAVSVEFGYPISLHLGMTLARMMLLLRSVTSPGRYHAFPACALRALGLLLADGALTVGRGKTF